MPSPSGATAKYAFPFLEETDAPDIATAMQDLAQAVENIILTYASGTIGSRPAAGKLGRWYYATDTGGLWFDTGSVWISPLSGNPSGRCWAASGSSVSGNQLMTMTNNQDLKGGMTFSSAGGNTGLVVPVTGIYLITGQVKFNEAGATDQLSAYAAKNSGATFLAYGTQMASLATTYNASVVACRRALTAGDVVNLGYVTSNTSVAFQIDPNDSSNYLDVVLVSQ